jgi:GTP-binding protein
MFVDELTIYAKAGNGGDGVVRWLRLRSMPKGGPAGGNGGKGGDVYIRGVKNLSLLSKYTGEKAFMAGNGESGAGRSKYGQGGDDMVIDLPVGAAVTDVDRGRTYRLDTVGETIKILSGGNGGFGNEHFKSSTNRSPEEQTKGVKGEEGTFKIELSLIVDVGLIGLPNAGKSTLLNTITNAKSAVGSYPFTTLEPHLGEFYGFILADVPGLIEGASEGKGLGHKFLKHVRRTKMLLHCVSLGSEDAIGAYTSVRNELKRFDPLLLDKDEWVVLTKSDLVPLDDVQKMKREFTDICENVSVISSETGDGVKELADKLTEKLQSGAEKVL